MCFSNFAKTVDSWPAEVYFAIVFSVSVFIDNAKSRYASLLLLERSCKTTACIESVDSKFAISCWTFFSEMEVPSRLIVAFEIRILERLSSSGFSGRDVLIASRILEFWSFSFDNLVNTVNLF